MVNYVENGLIVHFNLNNIDLVGGNGKDLKAQGIQQPVLKNMIPPYTSIQGRFTGIGYDASSGYGSASMGGIDQHYALLDGSDDYIVVENSKAVDLSTVTVQMICSIESFVNYLQLFSTKNTAGNKGFYLGLFESMEAVTRVYGGNVNTNDNITLVAGTLYNICFTLDAGNNEQKILINGANKKTFSDANYNGTTDNDWVIGATTGYLVKSNIKLYDFKVYNRVLSDAEILQNYNVGAVLPENRRTRRSNISKFVA